MSEQEQRDRAVEVAEAIDTYVAADVELATSLVGMGLDALAGALRTKGPETIRDLGPILRAAVAVFGYVERGEGNLTEIMHSIRS